MRPRSPANINHDSMLDHEKMTCTTNMNVNSREDCQAWNLSGDQYLGGFSFVHHTLTSRNRSYAPISATAPLLLVAERGMQDKPPNRRVCLTSSQTSPHLLSLHQSLFSHRLARHHPQLSIRRRARSTLLVRGLWENAVPTFQCYALVVDHEDVERWLASGWVVRGRAFVQEYLGRERSWPLYL